MEQHKATEANLTTVNLRSDSPHSIISLKPNPYSPLPKSNSEVKRIEMTNPPKLEPVADDPITRTIESVVRMSRLIEARAKSPSPTLALSVDASSSETPIPPPAEKCRACNPLHPHYSSYDKKRPEEYTEENASRWICCVHCKNWYHCECVDVEQYEQALLAAFSCPACSPEHGPSTEIQCVAPHRLKFYDKDEVKKPTEVGTKPWVEEFIKYEAEKFRPPPPELVVVLESGDSFKTRFDKDTEWKKIYFIKDKSGLGLEVPESGTIYIDQIIELLGEDIYVDTIDVYRQTTVQMSLGRYRELLNNPDRKRLYNILSLEFTGTELAHRIRPPSIVKELSWVERYWHDRNLGAADTLPSGLEETADPLHYYSRPQVDLFALLGMGGSFTDFHVDFGGSSVWYHVYRGTKIFYVVEPTLKNLGIYESHQNDKHDVSFLGDAFGDKCYRVVIEAGQTLLMPAGWIHAVYTPEDSLVFGGNFLTNLNVDLQCQIYAHELHCNMESRFVFPKFELVNWYAGRSFTEIIRDFIDDGCLPPLHLMRGAKALVDALSEWVKRDKESKDEEKQYALNRKFIHGHSQTYILNALAKEYKRMEVRMSPEVKAVVEMTRMAKKMERVETKRVPPNVSRLSMQMPAARFIRSNEPFRPQSSTTQTQRLHQRFFEGSTSRVPMMAANPIMVRRNDFTASRFPLSSVNPVLISVRKFGGEIKDGRAPAGRLTEPIASYRPPVYRRNDTTETKRESPNTTQTQRPGQRYSVASSNAPRYSVVSSNAPTQKPRAAPRLIHVSSPLVPNVKENEKKSGVIVPMVSRFFSFPHLGIQKTQSAVLLKQSGEKNGGETKNGRVPEMRLSDPMRPNRPQISSKNGSVETKRESAITTQTSKVGPRLSDGSTSRITTTTGNYNRSGETLSMVSFSPSTRSTMQTATDKRMGQFRSKMDKATEDDRDSSRGETLERTEGGGVKKETVKRKTEKDSFAIPPSKAKRVSSTESIDGDKL